MEYANWPIRSRQNIHCGNVDRKRTRGASRWRDATLSSHCQLQCRRWLSHFAGNNFCPRHWEKSIDFDLWKWCPSPRLGQKSYPKEQTQRREMYYFLNCTPLRHSSLSFHGRETYHIVQGCDGTHHVEHKKMYDEAGQVHHTCVLFVSSSLLQFHVSRQPRKRTAFFWSKHLTWNNTVSS